MNRFHKLALLAGAGLSAMMATAASAADMAAPAGDQPGAQTVGEVVVTARRQSEVAKDVPITVTAYSAQQMNLSGAADITELEKTTPNAVFSVSRGTNSTLTAYIRGIGQQDPLWGFEPGVGIYVDDIYIARPQLSVLDIYDVQSIEVLNGPQGTLYGRNTIGGALKYVSAKIPDHYEVDVKGNFGDYYKHDFIGSVKAPVADWMRASFSIASYNHNGYGRNLTTGSEQYNQDVLGMHAAVEILPAKDLFFRISADQTDDYSNAKHGYRLLPYTSQITGVTYNPLSSPYDTKAGEGDHQRVETRGVSLLGEWTASDHLTLKSITAYRDGHTPKSYIDFDETPEPILDVIGSYSDHQFTEELQGLWKSDKLHGVAGLYYMNATASGGFDTILGQYVKLAAGPPPVFLPYTINTNGYVITKSWSAYANGVYDLTNTLSVELGGRWTDDKKTGHVFRQGYIGLISPMFGGSSTPAGTPNTNYTNAKSFTKFTPRASLTWKITPDVTTYASYSNGFKSGGFDMRGDAKAYPATVNGYEPETVDSFEVGLKGSVFNHRLNFSTDVFDGEYKNIQVTTQYPGPKTIASVVDNVGAGYARGWEGQASLKLTSELSTSLTAGYLDAQYTKWLAAIPANTPPLCPGTSLCIVDVHKLRHFAYVSKLTGSWSATWTHDMGGNGRITVLPVVSYRSKYQIYETPSPMLDQAGYWLVDANISWTSSNRRYEVSLHGKNLTDERYHVGGYNFSQATTGNPGFGNSLDAFFGDPRTVYLTLAAKFY